VPFSVECVKTVKSQRDYRIGDIIFRRGYKWRESLDNVLAGQEFDGMILKDYLLSVSDQVSFDPYLFGEITHRRAESMGIVERKYEIGVHVRAGDVISVPHRFLSVDYVTQLRRILSGDSPYSKISFVVCMSYGNYFERGLWEYHDKKQMANQLCLEILFSEIEKSFNRHAELEVVSNDNPDVDLIHLFSSGYFLADQGGFSRVISEARLAHGRPSTKTA